VNEYHVTTSFNTFSNIEFIKDIIMYSNGTLSIFNPKTFFFVGKYSRQIAHTISCSHQDYPKIIFS